MIREKFNISNPQIKEVRVFTHLIPFTSSGGSYLEILRKIAIESLKEQEVEQLPYFCIKAPENASKLIKTHDMEGIRA